MVLFKGIFSFFKTMKMGMETFVQIIQNNLIFT